MQNYVGKQISHYHILQKVGLGGMAVVYHAYDNRLERDVALKLIRTDEIPASQHDRLMKRFEREAKAQARFTHPHVVPAYDYGDVEGVPYLVLAYMPGGTLKKRILDGVGVYEALEILTPIADAVAYAHQMGVLHRDIKPSNIIFSSDEVPMLTDFGIAKVLETTEATLTGTGLGVGTPEYMAPEQWQGNPLEASDQYALGVVLYELLTGQKPYTAETPLAVALKVINEPLQRPSDLNPSIPPKVEKTLYKALARDPEDRFESMRAFHQRLAALLVELKPSPPVAISKPTPVEMTVISSVTTDRLVSGTDTIDLLETQLAAKAKINSTDSFQSKQADEPKQKRFRWVLWLGSIIFVTGLVIGVYIMSHNSDQQVPQTVVGVVQEGTPTDPISIPEAALNPIIKSTDLNTATATSIQTLAPTETLTETPTETIEPEPSLGVGSVMVNPIDGAEMIYVPEGEFLMGVDEELQSFFLNSFLIYRYEVTNKQFMKFANATNHITTAESVGFSIYINYLSKSYAGANWRNPIISTYNLNNPVVHISWFDAKKYCEWAGGRLPTEKEWEKAARGIDGRKYPWGNDFPTPNLGSYSFYPFGCPCPDRNRYGLILGEIQPVGSFNEGVSPYGIFDLFGNVREWVEDSVDEDSYRVIKGSSYNSTLLFTGGSLSLEVSGWGRNLTEYTSSDLGFRCVYDQ